jgi:hypothetical protein
VRRDRSWKCVEQRCRQPGARAPDLDCDELVTGPVIVAEAARDALADYVVGLAGWKPSDVSAAIVVGVSHGSEDNGGSPGLCGQAPDGHDPRAALVPGLRMVVDGLDRHARTVFGKRDISSASPIRTSSDVIEATLLSKASKAGHTTCITDAGAGAGTPC